MANPVDLEVKPETGGSIISIPLSSTGSDAKAQVWAVRNDKGASLLKTDSQTSVTTIAGALTIPHYETNTARDEAIPSPVNGMIITNGQVASFQAYIGSEWITLATV